MQDHDRVGKIIELFDKVDGLKIVLKWCNHKAEVTVQPDDLIRLEIQAELMKSD